LLLAETSAMSVDALVAVSKGPEDTRYGWWRGQRFSQSVLERWGQAARRLCPECLTASAHHRLIWGIKYIAVCPIQQRFQAEADRVQAMPPFQDLVGSDIPDFLFRLGLERLGRRRKAFSTEHTGELAWEAHVALRLGLEAVEDWPEGFHREIDNMRERWGGDARMSLFRCVGAVEFWVDRLQEGSQGAAITAAVADYRTRDAARRGRRPDAKPIRRPW
jgi:hypothetical protein